MAGFESFIVRLSLEILRSYDGAMPLHRWLARYFREHKKLGSRDRRAIRELVYSYFRLGKCLHHLPAEERLRIAVFLTDALPLKELFSDTVFEATAAVNTEDRIAFVQQHYRGFSSRDLFPFESPLSAGIDRTALELSLLRQPLVWIRVRKNKLQQVVSEFAASGITILQEPSPGVYGLAQSVQLDKLESYNKGYFEIQDKSSQRTASLYHPKAGQQWWDACAASGGKSLLLLEQEPNVQLTVSDIRNSSLQNLEERFRRNGVRAVGAFSADLRAGNIPQLSGKIFDGVLVDAPCTGSGTWSRTPENIFFFGEEDIERMHRLQLDILQTASRYVMRGGALIYMTCSVFERENEAVVNAFLMNTDFQLEESCVFQGASERADTLFAARFVRIRA